MCAIFGSVDAIKFKELYDLNTHRGSSAHGLVLLYSNNNVDEACNIIKGKGIYNSFDDLIENKELYKYFTGHTQAPTSSAQEFNKSTSHPFFCGEWIVSHNGVITNFKELTKLVSADKINVVDSSIIPALLDAEDSNTTTEAKIVKALSKIKGTHSTTIYNTTLDKLYIARCGSTLFIDDNGNYSSTEFKGSESVKDGTLLEYRDSKFKLVESFTNNSPFFIL